MTRGTFRFPGKLTSWLLSLMAFYSDSPHQRQWEKAGEPPSFLRLSISKKKNLLKLRKCPRLISTNVFLNASVYATFIFRIKKLLVGVFVDLVLQGPHCIL